MGAAANFNTNFSKWKTLFPGIRSKILTLGFHFNVPFFREVIFSWGMAAASRESIITLLTQPTHKKSTCNADGYTSNGVMLIVGGSEEAFFASPRNYKVVTKKRKGFVRIALKTGSPIVPVISYNEVDVYEQVIFEPNSLGHRLQALVKKLTGVLPVIIRGRGFLQYSFGFIPKRTAITTISKQINNKYHLIIDFFFHFSWSTN